MATPNTQPGTASTLQAYEDKIAAQIHAANTRIDEFEAKAKPMRAQAEVTAINGLKAARTEHRTDAGRPQDDARRAGRTRQGRHRYGDRGIPGVARGLQAQVHDTVGEEVTGSADSGLPALPPAEIRREFKVKLAAGQITDVTLARRKQKAAAQWRARESAHWSALLWGSAGSLRARDSKRRGRRRVSQR